MIDVLLAFIAAVIVILVAGLLVNWQEKQKDDLKKSSDEITNRLGEAATEFTALSGKKPAQETLSNLEKDVKKINETLAKVQINNQNGRKKYAKRTKNYTND